MATPAQISANQINAQASTGPRTPNGKRNTAGNACSHGLFSAPGNFVRPEEQSAWDELNQALWNELSPAGALEATLTTEIVRAAWRLRRCAAVEASLSPHELDPMQDPRHIATQNAVDRARAQSQRTLHRALADLRALQSERLPAPQATAPAHSAKQTQFPRNTGRITPCPCGSTLKYKRCCGQYAPPVLTPPLATAA